MTFQRLAGLAGLMTTGLLVVGAVAGQAGGLPGSDDTAFQIVSHYRDHGASTAVSASANALAGLLLMVFAAALWQRLDRIRDQVVRGWAVVGVLGAGTTAVMVLVVTTLQFALPLAASRAAIDADGIAVLFAAWNAAVLVLGLALIPLLAGFGLAGLRGHGFPVWLAWVGFVGAAAALLGLGQALLPRPAGQVATLIASLQYPALLLWLAALSVVLLRPSSDTQSLARRRS